MTATKSSHKKRNIVIAILALWSIISLIIIVVWATSPDLKGASECNASLKNLKEKYADEKNTWNKDRHALEELVMQGRTNQSLLLTHIDQLKDQLRLLNQSLDSCLHHRVSVSDDWLLFPLYIMTWLLAIQEHNFDHGMFLSDFCNPLLKCFGDFEWEIRGVGVQAVIFLSKWKVIRKITRAMKYLSQIAKDEAKKNCYTRIRK